MDNNALQSCRITFVISSFMGARIQCSSEWLSTVTVRVIDSLLKILLDVLGVIREQYCDRFNDEK